MIGPHFTLVFARPAESHDLLVNHVEGVTSGMAAIDFVLRRTVLHVDPGVAYAFLEPQEGRQELLDLHRALNAGAPAADPATDPGAAPAWTPHITIGRSASAPEMRAVLQELRREEVAIAGRIATLTLIDVGLGRIRELGEWGLKKD